MSTVVTGSSNASTGRDVEVYSDTLFASSRNNLVERRRVSESIAQVAAGSAVDAVAGSCEADGWIPRVVVGQPCPRNGQCLLLLPLGEARIAPFLSMCLSNI